MQAMHPKRPQEIFPLFAATTALPGVGAKLAGILEKRIGTHVIDVLRHLPIGLIDRSARPALNEVEDGAAATFDVLVIKHDQPPRGVRHGTTHTCARACAQTRPLLWHDMRDGQLVNTATIRCMARGRRDTATHM